MSNASKSGGFLGFVKNAFVEDVPDAPKAAPIRESGPPPPPVPQTPLGDWKMQSAAPPAVAPDANALAKLEAKLQATLPPIYVAFMEQYEGLRDVIPDDGMRFKAALKTSKSSVEQLNGALDTLLNTMQSALSEFDKSFEENKNKVVTNAQQSIAATNGLIQTREQQLVAIQEEIDSLRAKRTNEQERLATEERRLEGIRGGFQAAHAQVVGRLNQQKAHIAQQRG